MIIEKFIPKSVRPRRGRTRLTHSKCYTHVNPPDLTKRNKKPYFFLAKPLILICAKTDSTA